MADDSMIPGVAAPYMKLVAGFAGAVISLAFLKDQSRWQNLLNVAGGCASAMFLAPVFVEWSGFRSEGPVNAITFMTGMLGMSFLAGIFVVAKIWRENPGNAAGAIADILGKLRGNK